MLSRNVVSDALLCVFIDNCLRLLEIKTIRGLVIQEMREILGMSQEANCP